MTGLLQSKYNAGSKQHVPGRTVEKVKLCQCYNPSSEPEAIQMVVPPDSSHPCWSQGIFALSHIQSLSHLYWAVTHWALRLSLPWTARKEDLTQWRSLHVNL